MIYEWPSWNTAIDYPNWAFIASQTLNYNISYTIELTIQINSNTPTTVFGTGIPPFVTYTGYARMVNYTTNNPNYLNYPNDVLDDNGTLIITTNSSNSFTLEMSKDCAYIWYNMSWNKLKMPTLSNLTYGF